MNITDYETGKYENIIDEQKALLRDLYRVETGSNDLLINGREYYSYFYRSELKPLLFISGKRTASITIGGQQFDDIELHYDTYLDEVIYSDQTKIFNTKICQVALNKEITDSFSLFFEEDTLHFRYLKDREDLRNLDPGFYEMVYEGNSDYIIRHRSSSHEKDGIEEYFYRPVNYISTGGDYRRLRSLRDCRKIFGLKFKHIRDYIRISHINIKQAGKDQIKGIIRYYDSLGTSENSQL
jgi:hypothetical protein